MVSKRGFRLKDCGRGNWGFGLRNGRIVPLLLDGRQQLDQTRPLGRALRQMATQKTHRQLLAITARTPWASFCGDLSRSLLSPERDAVRHQPHLRIFTETPLGAGFPANLEPIQGRLVPHPPYFYHLGMWLWILCTVFLLLRLYFFGTSTLIFVLRSMHSNLFPIRSHLVHYVEDCVVNPKIFLFTFSPYITIGLLAFLVYQPYVILPFMSSPLITSSFEHFPWDTSLSHSCLRISDSIDSTVLYRLLHLLEWFSLLFMGVFLAITISPDSCCWVICAIWINGSELLDPACCDFESDISSRWKRATSWRQWQRTFEWMYF